MNIKKICFNIATGYVLNPLPFSSVIISLAALPVSLFLKLVKSSFLTELCVVGVLALLTFIIIHFAQSYLPP